MDRKIVEQSASHLQRPSSRMIAKICVWSIALGPSERDQAFRGSCRSKNGAFCLDQRQMARKSLVPDMRKK